MKCKGGTLGFCFRGCWVQIATDWVQIAAICHWYKWQIALTETGAICHFHSFVWCKWQIAVHLCTNRSDVHFRGVQIASDLLFSTVTNSKSLAIFPVQGANRSDLHRANRSP